MRTHLHWDPTPIYWTEEENPQGQNHLIVYYSTTKYHTLQNNKEGTDIQQSHAKFALFSVCKNSTANVTFKTFYLVLRIDLFLLISYEKNQLKNLLEFYFVMIWRIFILIWNYFILITIPNTWWGPSLLLLHPLAIEQQVDGNSTQVSTSSRPFCPLTATQTHSTENFNSGINSTRILSQLDIQKTVSILVEGSK